ncbi:putative tol protein [Glarea lozoyensis ATCC 20868]|uniref:Putative tol protein n=1 Tax=Glarea lozoyensis (strain ATCC 20868 / MF5171) TaxID=1116229 RepID=S3D1C6_GLAL2|nr:putative tol protein [Glarea lozoyensis ATCC 20868]EPE32322.1 putative tol protein [Glarea lozoyensis ATCC 20868]
MWDIIPARKSEAVESDATERGGGENREDKEDDNREYSGSDSETIKSQSSDDIFPFLKKSPSPRTWNRRCCPTCEAMTGTLEGLSALVSGGYQHLNWYQICENTNLGCRLCWEIQHIPGVWLRDDDGNLPLEEVIIRAITSVPSKNEIGSVKHPFENLLLQNLEIIIPSLVVYEKSEFPPRQILFHPVTWEDDGAARFIQGRRETKDMSPEVVGMIHQKLDNCFGNHLSCPRRRSPELPRRVLDVGSGTSPIRIYHPAENEKAEYATLSYCWGSGVEHITTTTSNLSEYMVALPRDLPKTILDAIEVCQKICVRYLWIDALCIIQDDESDKLDQIATMGSIYKSSFISIVAASAQDVSQGFLKSNFAEPSVELPFFIDGDTCGIVYLRMFPVGLIYAEDEPTFGRAWTLQEYMLSPRILVFDCCQITFNCRKESFQPVVETHLEVIYNCTTLPVSVFGVLDDDPAYKQRLLLGNDKRDLQEWTWSQIIWEYSKRDLTHFEDRLPALAGIASELALVWNDTYLAGFWKRSIMHHLGWFRLVELKNMRPMKKIFQHIDRSQRLGSPSWSWITMPYPIRIDPPEHIDAKLIDSKVELVSETSPFGQISRALITLEARILEAKNLDVIRKESHPASSDRGIVFDFETPIDRLDDFRLLYLSCQAGEWFGEHRGLFLVVEQSALGMFKRVGHIWLDDSEPVWKDLLNAAKREVVVLE